MPRKWFETVQDWPALVAGRGYDVRIQDVAKVADPPGVCVLLEFVGGEQGGRQLAIVLSLPCRPGDAMATLLGSSGVDVSAGVRFAPRDFVGWTVVAFFASAPGGDAAVARFAASRADESP